ncbi:hypothetical protein [Nitrospirillum sp. BR 11163]|nr:hypothetical protein [Nitrospirillum sp. BR 11163]MEA1676892.1 hypothetical protein [Nitrospirillum sp. BR 11163]
MNTKRSMIKLTIPTDPTDWHGVAMEHVWATPLVAISTSWRTPRAAPMA